MGQYSSYYKYQKYEKRGEQDWIPVYPNIFSISGDSEITMSLVLKSECDANCGCQTTIYRWVDLDPSVDWICDECETPQYRWQPSGYTCVGYDKWNRSIKQVSYDEGSTWQNVEPLQESATTLIEVNSEYCGYVPPTPSPYASQYFTLEALEDCVFNFKFGDTMIGLSYSRNSGTSWGYIVGSVASISASTNEKIMFKMDNPTVGDTSIGIGSFSGTTGRFNAEGNVMSLIYGDNFSGQTSFPLSYTGYVFSNLFSNSEIVSAENLVLPATTLVTSCYHQMFSGCTSLTTAPNELPARILENFCYWSMFYGCRSLTTAPELPATTLTYRCYYSMFTNCSSLTTAPELLATTLTTDCYRGMFSGCTSLNYIKCLATDISANRCTYNWVNGVAASGTFVKNASMSGWGSCGTSKIPCNWTIQNV